MSATGAENVTIRDAAPDDAVAACRVLRESISRLCAANHRNDPAILNAWLAAPTGKFGTSSGYPMSKQMVASQ